MSVRSPSPSQFRPKAGIDQSVLENNKALLAEVDRRKFLRGSLSLGALAMLTGCDVTSQDTVQAALRAVSSFNDRIQADRKSTRLNSSHCALSRMPSSA